jgi:hypothetical protein
MGAKIWARVGQSFDGKIVRSGTGGNGENRKDCVLRVPCGCDATRVACEGGILASAVCFLLADNIFHASSVGRGVGQRLSYRKSTDILGEITLSAWVHKLGWERPISVWSMNGGPVQKSIGLAKPLDDSMKLVVKVVSDRKFTKVRFDLKDVPLP